MIMFNFIIFNYVKSDLSRWFSTGVRLSGFGFETRWRNIPKAQTTSWKVNKQPTETNGDSPEEGEEDEDGKENRQGEDDNGWNHILLLQEWQLAISAYNWMVMKILIEIFRKTRGQKVMLVNE